MSLAITDRPKRLARQRGRWTLEVERYVTIDRHVLRPRSQRIEGEKRILGALEASRDGGTLALAAQRLMQSVAADDVGERMYEPGDRDWVATHGRPLSVVPEARDAETPGAASHPRSDGAGRDLLQVVVRRLARIEQLIFEQRNETSRQLTHVIDAQERLVARLEGLERKLGSRTAGGAAAGAAAGVAAGATAGAPAEARPPSIIPAAPPAPRISIVPPPMAEAPEAAHAAEPPARFVLPPLEAVVECARQLVGEGFAPTVTAKPERFLRRAYYLAAIVGDDGQTLGAFVVDTRAAVQLGGRLLMMPAAELADQVRHGQPSEEVLSATSELVNTLMSTLNHVPGNPHARAHALAPIDPVADAWTSSPAAALDLTDAEAGRLLLLVHPA